MGLSLRRQWLVLGLAAGLWSCAPEPSLLALLGAYFAALLLLELPPGRRVADALSPAAVLLLSAALAAPGIAYGLRAGDELLSREGLFGASARLADRARLQWLPAIAPGLLTGDRPQTLFVYAPGAPKLELSLGGRARNLAGEALGEGVFRVEYDPRKDGMPPSAGGEAKVQVRVGQHTHERTLRAVTPLAHPRWFCVAPDRRLAACVSEETDELFWFDGSGLVRRTRTGDGPVDCAFIAADEIAVSFNHQTRLELHRAGDPAPRSLELGAPQGRMARSPSGHLLSVSLHGAHPALAFVQLASLSQLQRLPLSGAADWLEFGPDDDSLVLATRRDATLTRVTRPPGGSYALDRTLELGRPAVTLARDASGQTLWAATTDLHPRQTPQLGNHFVDDQLLEIDSAQLSVRSQLRTARRSERQTRAGDVDLGLSPSGLHQARDLGWLVAFAGSDELARIGTGGGGARLPPQSLDLEPSGLYAPHGVAELADGTLLVSSPVAGAVGVLAPGETRPQVVQLARDDAWLLSHDRAALARRVGERGFYEATRSGIACQSCHIHADSDDAAYNLGDRRLLPTLTVRGLLGTAPYLRDGSYPRLRDLHEVADDRYRGYRRRQAARELTLEAFVEALPRPERPGRFEALDRAAVQRGLRAFVQARCPSCHTPPAFTNLSQVPMGQLFPELPAELGSELVDTPSLLSVSATAPYLSDGRAATLRDVIERHNGRNQHGDVKSLHQAARRDLLTFLESL